MPTAALSPSPFTTPVSSQPPPLPSHRFLSHSGLFTSAPAPAFVKSAPRICSRGYERLRSRMGLSASAMTTGFSSDVGDALGEIEIFRVSGESVAFKDLWDQQEGVAVVALLRHFGCPCCWELAAALKEVKPRFDSAGVKLIAVGVGTPDKAQILADRLPFPNDCLYADPERKAYNLFDLYYGFGRTFFNPASRKVLSRFEALKKATKDYTIKATPSDRSSVLQQGGMFVFKGKQLLYGRKDEGTGDHASLEEVFDVCCKVPIA